MSHSPQKPAGSKRYSDAWRAVNELVRADGSWSGRERNTCYRNEGGGQFGDVSWVSGLDFDGDGRAFAAFDYDHDGDLDLLVKFRTAPQIRLMRNESAGAGRSLRVQLTGTGSNRDAVGARAILETDRRRLTREVASGSSYLAQHSRRLHFGLEPEETVRSLRIVWPGGKMGEVRSLPASGLIRIQEGSDSAEAWSRPRPARFSSAAPEPFVESRGTWLVESVPAPDFTLKALDGREHTLSAYRGRKVLLTFWATWCPPCRKELEDLRNNAGQFRDAGVEVLAVSVDEPTEAAAVRRFAGELKLPFPVLLANEHAVAVYSVLNRYLFDRRRDLGIPTSFLADAEGRIVKVYVGDTPVASIVADAGPMQGSPTPFSGKRLTPLGGRNYLDLGTAMAERGLNAEARLMFEAAIRSGQQGELLYTNLGTLLMESGELDKAEELLQTSLGRNPAQVEARINLGMLLLRRNRPADALPHLARAREMFPDDAVVLNALGTAHFQTGQRAEAERWFREAVRFDADSAESHYNLGAVLAGSGRRGEAIEKFEASRRLGRNTADVNNNLGVLYMETGEPGKARSSFERAHEAEPGHYGTLMNLAMFHVKTGDAGQGLVWVKRAQEAQPGEPAAFLLEAQMLIASGQRQRAKAVLEALLERSPGLTQAREMLEGVR